MSMVNLGKKPSKTTEVGSVAPSAPKVYYPDLMISDIDIGLSDKDAGKKFTATITGVIRRISKTARADGTKNNDVSLEIHGIDFGGKSSAESIADSFYHGKKK